ncbi:pyridine nucleotide-disulfide oxidoreductase domain-containing protein 1 [Neocloeon triangulifer]|uniref:pyridine nucleotide-disulfide oxidoreductase domain-containing protein 1 n=1 Tax=Neocloeon triangulifer TaxID=2078957 RepID=UPI00286F82B5|nr:pyridine nucleotide-disulfide oxidoreductase domain-containing protein 1 [Neocloeon triangulifer]
MDLQASYIVVGGGIAGISCVETLNTLTQESILLISGSDVVRVTTNINQLTQALVQFDVEEKTASELEKSCPGLKVVTGVTLVSLDPELKQLKLSDGRVACYERSVCLCLGASPKKLCGSENAADLVLTLRDMESVASLMEKLKSAKKVAVVGNGGIATELVYTLKGVQDIVWIVRDKHISAAFVDPGAAQFFMSSGALTEAGQKKPETIIKRLTYKSFKGEKKECQGAALGPDWHSKFNIQGPAGDQMPNIKVEYETEVKKILRRGDSDFPKKHNEWPMVLELVNGNFIGCDLVVNAIGVVPNCKPFEGILELADAQLGTGIKIDKGMRTSAPGVFAAGDIVFADWPKEKHWFQMRLWTQARQMGSQAARSMATPSSAAMFDFSFELFAHVTTFFGFKVVLLGLYNGQGMDPSTWEALVRVTPGKEFIKLIISNGKVHGAVLIGNTELEETCENLILNQLDVSALGDDLLNPDVDIEDYFD